MGKTTQRTTAALRPKTIEKRVKTGWQYRADGSLKSFDELSNPEVLTWIGTLPEGERAGAAEQFEREYLKNPGSTRYDPYYTDYSNNDEARQLFGTNVFDQAWINNNRGYLNYLTFTDENYTSPKKPGNGASEMEKMAYEYWKIANTYEQTTQAAESEYAELRKEIQDKVASAKALSTSISTDELLEEIDWSDYKTLENLREASYAGNGRYLNRPVQVGDASLRAMINSAIRGEDVTEARDFVQAESEWISSRPETVDAALKLGYSDWKEGTLLGEKRSPVAISDLETLSAAAGAMQATEGLKKQQRKARLATTEEETQEEPAAEEERNFWGRMADTVTGWFGGDEETQATAEPEATPTVAPTQTPTPAPTEEPTQKPTQEPTEKPTEQPTAKTDTTSEEMLELDEARLDALNNMVNSTPLSEEEYEAAEKEINNIQGRIDAVSPEAAAQGNQLAGWQQRFVENRVIEAFGSVEVEDAEDAPVYNEYVGSHRSMYGLDMTIEHVEHELMMFDREDPELYSEEEIEFYESLRGQLDLLKVEKTNREEIEKRVEEGAKSIETAWGADVPVIRWLWNREWLDALNDGDKVPMDDYEEFLRYRMTPGEGNVQAYADMAQYDQVGGFEGRASLAVEGVATGFDKAATASSQGLEYVLYTIARKLPEYEGMTKEEIYASNRSLSALKGWNDQHSRQYIDEETKAELTEEFPAFSMVAAGVSEMLKMTGQTGGMGLQFGINPSYSYGLNAGDYAANIANMSADMALKFGLEPSKWAKAIQAADGLGKKAASWMPFALDVYGSTYETAITEGATDDQAAMAGTINAMITGSLSELTVKGLKVAGAKLFASRSAQKAAAEGAVTAAKNGWGKTVLNAAKQLGLSMLEEGAEEAIEEPIQSVIAKAVYDRDRAWFGEGGVFDPAAMAQSGLGGAIAGPMFSITSGLSGRMGRAAQTKAEAIVESAMNGEAIGAEDVQQLSRIELKEALYQDEVERLTAERADELKALTEKHEQLVEEARKAYETSEAAQAEYNAAAKANEGLMGEFNGGTRSYVDADSQQLMDDAQKRLEAAKEAAEQAKEAYVKADAAANMAAEPIGAIRDEIEQMAREEAEKQYPEAIQTNAQQDEPEPEAPTETQIQPGMEETQATAEEEAVQAGVQYQNVEAAYLTPDQQSQMRILDALGRKYGLEIDIVDTIGNGKANASYAGGRRITVALDAMDEAYVQAGVHEMVHYVKNASEDAYGALESVVTDWLKKTEGYDLEEAIEERMAEYGGEITREMALEEIVAEAAPAVMTDENAARELVKNDAGLIARIRDLLIDFVEKLKEFAANYSVSANRPEMDAVRSSTEALMDIAQTLDSALEEARGARVKEGVERYSLRGDGTAAGKRDALVTDATDMTTEEETDIKRSREHEWASSQIREIARVAAKNYKTKLKRAELVEGLYEVLDAYDAGEDAEGAADRLARRIVENSLDTDDTLRNQYSKVRKHLQESGVSLTDTQKQEVANQYGSYDAWRKGIMGRVLIKNAAKSLDAQWSELSGMAPEYFDPDTNEAQMPEALVRFADDMRVRYANPYGATLEEAAAQLSLELQGEIQRVRGKTDEAAQLSRDAKEMEARSEIESKRKQDDLRREKQDRFRRMAAKMKRARESGNDAELKKALDEYRAEARGDMAAAMKADAAEIGIRIRKMQTDLNRMNTLVSQLSDSIQDADNDMNRERLIAERDSYVELRESLRRQINTLKRQEAITRTDGVIVSGEGDIASAAERAEWESEAVEDTLNKDMRDSIWYTRDEMKDRISALGDRMRKVMRDYNMTSTIPRSAVADTFRDIEGELTMQSELAKTWKARKEGAKNQIDAEQAQERALRRQLAQAIDKGDTAAANTARELLLESADRLNVLKSQEKLAEAQERYARKLGAISLEQALNEGKIPQPIMERVIAMCAGASRQGKWNSNPLLRGAEAIRLNATTAARVYDDLFGEAAPLMRAIYYDPVMDNETDRQRWIADWRKRIGDLKLSAKESELVQKIGEAKIDQSDPEYQQAGEKVLNAVRVFREFYDQAHEMASKALERNGYDRPGRIGNYFPHIEKANSFWEKLGIPVDDGSLPTSINGLTDTFSPGKQYSGHLEHRTGETTDFDALYGFEEYINSISNVIYHTDDIQRHRQLETEIRAAAKNGVFGTDKAGQTHLSEFVKWVHEYTNLLAGKKSVIDRPIEGAAGRPIYRAVTALKGIKGSSAVSGNLASAITNVVPVTQIVAEHPWATLKGAWQMVKGNVAGRGNVPQSQYMIRKYGSDSVIKTGYIMFEKALKKGNKAAELAVAAADKGKRLAGWAFDSVDMFATKLVINAYYQNNLDMGMDSETAMRSADAKAARLMGDRSKGAMPNIYGSQVLGFFTQFQLEVANQSQHFRKDIWREKGFKKALITLFLTSITGHLWNEINERITGRRPAADPIQMIMDMYEAGEGGALPVAQAAYNNVSEMFPYSGGGRIAAFEDVGGLIEAAFTEGNDWSDVAYSAGQLAYGMLPMGNQIKKAVRGLWANARGGYYNASGTQLYFPVSDDPVTAAQAVLFGPTSIEAGRKYYAGEADKLSKSSTEKYEQARERGASSTEAYKNEAAKAQADKLQSAAESTENAVEDNEAKERANEPTTPVDTSQVESQKKEAASLREDAIPGDMLTDYWWERKDSQAVKNGMAIWRETGDDWAMPYKYSTKKSYTIDGRKEYIDAELLKEVEARYEEGYMEILDGIDITKATEEEKEEIKEMLEDLYAETNKWAKDEIRKRNEAREE